MSAIEGTVLITGAGSGMGRLATQRFADRGLKVAALDVNEEGLVETRASHEHIQTWTCDVTDYAAVESAVAEAESSLGPIHTVYNAAAIMPLGKLVDQDTAVIHKIMDINYGGVVNVAKATLPRMLERKSGSMVIFASMAGWIPAIYMGAYNASKFAVVAFTEVLYHENRDSGVRFACVCPPPVATPLLQQGRDTVWPKLLDDAPPIEPVEVLDEIEKSLDAGKFFVFPGKQTAIGYRVRRFIPNLLWKNIHKVEGV